MVTNHIFPYAPRGLLYFTKYLNTITCYKIVLVNFDGFRSSNAVLIRYKCPLERLELIRLGTLIGSKENINSTVSKNPLMCWLNTAWPVPLNATDKTRITWARGEFL
jgi:hypothetical protein